ncbi:LpxL/LpxP family Kdo(2)-lipid IV(A) lauroyl/palmitoleoyl acyltransferase [Pectobacterium sp. FL60-S17]|uniref:Lipid A biosynthesis acyltransferase n=1 Tax=Pectobacterium quasiaquaticum TaxID=2774015 RepID=A0A9Q2EME6_9GAMM|nr:MULTISPECIES: LpxL/LpxP family Kdo(2)-lipid IV(A) lauroyl/palmitoleoyl acyltransferase [Pectobacterium]MBE5203766.1 LpxL/LpxP family Kdo(2)-lipid IV(A) lauroyl/palmitoleoyl acyltransferase [Pectobacterium quasiaquaticum]MBE5211322.1 LpxL/LpxP family Kdo(2)-lipid IV(A) lauroyl/palmitoleoyl acyltransferase [Pectobacterium quasiaquaticum]MBE5214787.1 LpxL/LpxP family Kdo(2)-lipid IV(A) lauroyl/palmitoleoyl acyltransferase [Pectobacterium quasiaquaticum]MBE5222972.1 LpxL/LpxP family Kdo(2)-lipid
MFNRYRFFLSYGHPRYWLLWLGLGILFLLVQLPYPILVVFGGWLGRQSMRFLKRRVAIARRNLMLCFPDISSQQLESKLIDNFSSLGIALLETGMAWFWSDRRIKEWVDIIGITHLQEADSKRCGVIVVGVHFMTLELHFRILGHCKSMTVMYRPHNNKVLELVQKWGRSRSGNVLVDRKKLISMVHTLKQGGIVWFAPDQDYGVKGSVFVPFLGVERAATSNGTFIIAKLTRSELVTAVVIRKDGGKGYQLIISPILEEYPYDDSLLAAHYLNKMIEHEIMRAPEQYLWLHRRFKTRPHGEPSLYI